MVCFEQQLLKNIYNHNIFDQSLLQPIRLCSGLVMLDHIGVELEPLTLSSVFLYCDFQIHFIKLVS